ARDLGKKRTGGRKLMDHRESEDKVHCAVEANQAHRIPLSEAGIKPVEKSGLSRAMLQHQQHPWLYLNSHASAGRARQLKELQGEEAHTRARLEDDHTFTNVGTKDFAGIMPQAAYGTHKQVAEPPRTNAMFRHLSPLSRMWEHPQDICGGELSIM